MKEDCQISDNKRKKNRKEHGKNMTMDNTACIWQLAGYIDKEDCQENDKVTIITIARFVTTVKSICHAIGCQ